MRFFIHVPIVLIRFLYVNVFALLLFIRAATAASIAVITQEPELNRARKRLRVESPPVHSPTASSASAVRDFTDHASSLSTLNKSSASTDMRFSESDQDSSLSVSPDFTSFAGPSASASAPMGLGVPGPSSSSTSNGYQNNGTSTNGSAGNGFVATNGSNSNGFVAGNGVNKMHGKAIARINLPGTLLYEDDDSHLDREEYVRLVIQSLKDVGYIESAATLEAESGYSMETQEVSQFRQHILNGHWAKAEAALTRLGVHEEDKLLEAKFLISEQKYLELLEAKKTTAALYVLRNELAPLDVDPDHLHMLSSMIMCSDPEDLRQRGSWDGASGTSRQHLLNNLHRYVPSSVMIPQRRFSTLLQQARLYQRSRCVYHNSPSNTMAFSLYTDHQCNKSAFPRITTTILDGHQDEVWNIEWSHDGSYLASASKDKTVIIWRLIYSGQDSSAHDWSIHLMLKDHPYSVGCLAWSIDDSLLLTSAENYIKIWNAKTGVCLCTLDEHTETVTALAWLPDGSGFISGGLDRKIMQWDADGKLKESWGVTAIRVTDLAITPDFTRLVTIGMDHQASNESNTSRGTTGEHQPYATGGNAPTTGNTSRSTNNRLIVYDLGSKQAITSVRLEGELTSVKVSLNSQYALINHSPDEIHLWDLIAGRLARKFAGQSQGRHVIRSCFGGIDGNFIVSGSEDGKVYVWHRETGSLLEVLPGHGEGSVNSVAWNPRNERMFASCSDDFTIRIWEPIMPEMLADDAETGIVGGSSSALAGGATAASSLANGKGKTRQHEQRWGGESGGPVEPSSSAVASGSGGGGGGADLFSMFST